MIDPAQIKVSAGGEAVMRALALAVIDPGSLTLEEAAHRALIGYPQGMTRVCNRLVDDGLVTLDGWDGGKHSEATLTELGWAVVEARRWPICTDRT